MANERLASYISRIENLNEDKKGITDDIKDVYAEAKASGFNTKILRMVVKIRAMDKDEREEQEALLDTYMAELEGSKVNA